MLPTSPRASLAIYTTATAITKDDAAANVYSALWVAGGGGNVKLTTLDGQAVMFSTVTAGTILPVATSVVWSTGTVPTVLFGLK